MTLKQETIVMHRTDEQGNKVIQHPVTKGENIETPVPITAGGLRSKSVVEALIALGLDKTIQDLSISGTAVTITLKDGTTKTVYTQDTGITANQQKSTDGYIKFSNGIIIQWGCSRAFSSKWATFPIPFTTTNYFAFAMFQDRNDTTGSGWGWAYSRSTTGCNFVIDEPNWGWFAIGY